MPEEGLTPITRLAYHIARSLPPAEAKALREALNRFDHLESGEITGEDVTLIRRYLYPKEARDVRQQS